MPKILVADDIEHNRRLLRRVLEQSGYVVVDAVDGAEVVELYQQEKPDLILMDLNMPVLDGREATRKIKMMAGGYYIPVIFVTAMKAELALADSLTYGGDDFISKPLDMEVLKSKILVHLRIRELNRQLSETNSKLMAHNQRLAHDQYLIEYFFQNALRQSFLDPAYIKHHISPVSAFNGDLLLTERGPNGGLYLLLGDFTGHGLAAAMGTLPVAQAFFKMSRKGFEIGDIAKEINHHLVELMPAEMFFTAILFVISPTGKQLSIWAGGMPEAYLLDSDGEIKSVVRSQHMPLGILEDQEFDGAIDILTVAKGDRLYLYTDGVTETTCSDGEMFGNERLKACLLNCDKDRFQNVLETLRGFRGSENQEDDTTFVEFICDSIPPAKQEKQVCSNREAQVAPFQISVTLSASEIRELDPVTQLVNMLATKSDLACHKGLLHTLLSEMYLNVVEHGVLGLDSSQKTDDEQFLAYYTNREQALQKLEHGKVTIAITHEQEPAGGHLRIQLTHSGNGFNGRVSENKCVDALHGRGMAIIHGLCKHVTYSEENRMVEAIYSLC